MFKSLTGRVQWLLGRVAVIYVVLFIFCLTCVDLKTLDMRIKLRHLNDAIPDFSSMIIYSKDQDEKDSINWKPYKDYFELILRYMPEEMVTKALLGYVDFYTGQEEKAIDLFKASALINGQALFWPNYNLGVIYYKKGMWPQAAEYLFRAVSSNLRLTVLLMKDSMVYRQIFLNRAFNYTLSDEINDAQSHAFILLLSSLQHLGQYDKMLVISNLALAHNDLSYRDAFYFYAGVSFLEIGQPQKALMFFQKSLSIEEDNPDVYLYIANIYQKAGQEEQARYFLQASFMLHQKNDQRFPYDKDVNLRFF